MDTIVVKGTIPAGQCHQIGALHRHPRIDPTFAQYSVKSCPEKSGLIMQVWGLDVQCNDSY